MGLSNKVILIPLLREKDLFSIQNRFFLFACLPVRCQAGNNTQPVRRPVRQCHPDGLQPDRNDKTLCARMVAHFIQL